VVGTVLSPLRNLDITGLGLKWDCPDGFQRQCYPLLAAWVRDYPKQVIVAQVSYRPCPMCEIRKGSPMGHSTFQPLDTPQHRHYYLELLDKTNIDVLHTLGVHPIRKQFWQYPLCNVYRLWQPDALHQLLLSLVKDLLHCLLKYLKARNVKDLFDNRVTSEPRYPGLRRFSKPFDPMKSRSWQGKHIRAWSEHWWWRALRFLTAPRMPGKPRRKQPLMKWWCEQCVRYGSSLYLSADKMTLIYPSQH